jgi:hypothetical protein
MNKTGIAGGNLGDGITFVLMGCFFVWLGYKQKSPKKILGMRYQLFASLVGALFIIYGIVDLVAGARVLLGL